MTKFSEYKKQNIKNNLAKSEKKMEESDIAEMIEKYSKLDKNSLMQEFLSASKAKRDAGGLSDEEVNRLESTLSPYLNSEQKEMLGRLMEMGKNVQ